LAAAGLPHTFARGEEEVQCVGVTSPAGIEAMFEEQAAYSPACKDHRIIRTSPNGARFGVSVVGPPLDV
jgi:hypothetical protein